MARKANYQAPIPQHLATPRPTHNGCFYRRVIAPSKCLENPNGVRLAWEIECPGVPKKLVYTLDAVDMFSRSVGDALPEGLCRSVVPL